MGLDELTTEFKVDVLRNINYEIVEVACQVPAGGTGAEPAETKTLYMAYRYPSEEAHVYDGLSYEELIAHPDYIDNAFYRMCEVVHQNTGWEIE